MKKNIAIAVLVGLLSVKSGLFIPGYEICIFFSMALTGFFMAIGIEELDSRAMRIRHQKILTAFLGSFKK